MSEDKRTRHRICVVGSANVDLTFWAPRLPVPGETLAGRSLHQGMGGTQTSFPTLDEVSNWSRREDST